MMLETLVQASAWLLRFTEDFQYSTILLKEARAVRFNNFVSPGRSLIVTATVHEWGVRETILKGSGTVDGLSAVSARLTLQQFNLSERGKEWEASDRLRVERMRELFAQIWSGSEQQ
jgi:3-hydroxyacyl-[acyl-carrier-protein] dehydratase